MTTCPVGSGLRIVLLLHIGVLHGHLLRLHFSEVAANQGPFGMPVARAVTHARGGALPGILCTLTHLVDPLTELVGRCFDGIEVLYFSVEV